ncbi:MAG: J domain-containing protein, partial [Acidimicrobiaceae bacterium]|nr:J domain-containing protein [Acidimicrobiaceae bacterium]
MDPYAVLGVARDAPVSEIRRAYVALARSTHPDVRGDDPAAAEQMRRINLAWEMLSDADSRAAIDRRLRQPPPASRGPRPAPGVLYTTPGP